jgi:hypothetical protein
MLISCLPGAVGMGIAIWVMFIGVSRLSAYLDIRFRHGGQVI